MIIFNKVQLHKLILKNIYTYIFIIIKNTINVQKEQNLVIYISYKNKLYNINSF